jgi:hypothetical protein
VRDNDGYAKIIMGRYRFLTDREWGNIKIPAGKQGGRQPRD